MTSKTVMTPWRVPCCGGNSIAGTESCVYQFPFAGTEDIVPSVCKCVVAPTRNFYCSFLLVNIVVKIMPYNHEQGKSGAMWNDVAANWAEDTKKHGWKVCSIIICIESLHRMNMYPC